MAALGLAPKFSLERALGTENHRALRKLPSSLATLRRLRAVHEKLWALEDRARSTRAADAEIAAIKREIDRMNGERHRLIDQADRALAAGALAGSRARLRRYSETAGEICDRLLILDLKAENVERLSTDLELPERERARCRDKLALQLERRGHVQKCLREQLLDQEAGRALLVPRGEFKLYNEPALNPVMRRERLA